MNLNQEMANIFNIQPFSTQDGPGVRTTVFFKGCNLNCAWCHNPESIQRKSQLQFNFSRCIGCGNCFKTCKNGAHFVGENGAHVIDKAHCTDCGECANSCYSKALVLVGAPMTVEKVFKQVLADRPYYGKDGGVTASGGECLLYPEFLKSLFTLCRESGIGTAIDTAGNVDFSIIAPLLPLTDYFLYDVKAVDSNLHQKLTGAGNERILQNLAKLLDVGANVIVRIPCIPNANLHDLKNAPLLFLKSKPLLVELLPYHHLGEGKSAALSREFQKFIAPTEAEMQELLAIFKAQGINTSYTR